MAEQDPRYGTCQHEFAPGGLTCVQCFRTFTPFEVKRIKDAQAGFRVEGPDGESLTVDQAIDALDEEDKVARICRPVKILSPGGVSPDSVQKQCALCGQAVWYSTDQPNPMPHLKEEIVCWECMFSKAELREAALDPSKWLGLMD